jgi:hypothetical protein
MATRATCDNCGAEPAHRVRVDLATSGPKEVFHFSDVPVFDADLCERCFGAFKRSIAPVLMANVIATERAKS